MLRAMFVAAVGACIPGIWFVITGSHIAPPQEALIFGLSILGAAFVLSWAAEVAQMDMSQALAIAILALICVLPEYAVDLYFAWRAAEDPVYGHYAAANMTGANRLLVGLGWPAVFLIFFLRFRKKSLSLEPSHRTEVIFLGLATIYSFILPFKKTLALGDTLVFVALFALYAWRVAKAEAHEVHLVGPAKLIGGLPAVKRRILVIAMFLFSGVTIFMSAEHFAEALIHTGKTWGISEFLLVQRLAPLASEAPEFIIALLWTFRGDAAAGLGALVSSKVNQWTLLIGTIPLVYSFALGRPGQLPLDLRQQHELLLTACQSLFAVAILLNLRMSWYGAMALFVLFVAQLIFEQIRVQMSIVYAIFAVIVLFRDRNHIFGLFRRRA